MERFQEARNQQNTSCSYVSFDTRRTKTPHAARLLAALLGVVLLISLGCSQPDATIQGQDPHVSGAAAGKIPARTFEIRDLTRDGCPPELLAQTQAAANGHAVRVRDHRRPWLSAKVFRFWTDTGTCLTFMARESKYLQVNSKSDFKAINDLLREYKFAPDDFNDPETAVRFLQEVVSLYGDRPGMRVGSDVMLWMCKVDGGIDLWLQGTEKDEEVLRELCCDPQFWFEGEYRFSGEKWNVAFHVFKQGGSVEKWKMKGEYDEEKKRVKIRAIDIAVVKPRGTFYYEEMR